MEQPPILYQALIDIVGLASKKLYAKAGEIVTLVSDQGNALILEDANDLRFPVNINEVKPYTDDCTTYLPSNTAAAGLLHSEKHQPPAHKGYESNGPATEASDTIIPARTDTQSEMPIKGGQTRQTSSGPARSEKAAKKQHNQSSLFYYKNQNPNSHAK